MQIRTIEPRDIPALEHICLATAPPALKKDVGRAKPRCYNTIAGTRAVRANIASP